MFKPEQIGPSDVQHGNGVIDILVPDEASAVAGVKHYLAFFQGATTGGVAPDGLSLRAVMPENRLRVYDTLAAITPPIRARQRHQHGHAPGD